ncbi:MAG: actin family protein [Candidatus Heimdallarchaeota archaeon]|nr:actin family protein [Candidatus Heimdallarchaeota archaeon]MDH5647126.1 actin family protein [Candidatus Heimdallarchaeota archaeon]
MANSNPNQAIIIDNGSSYMKCDFNNFELPRYVTQTVISNPKPKFKSEGYHKDYQIGSFALQVPPENFNTVFPICNGKMRHWDELKQIWSDIFYSQLRSSPSEHLVLILDHIHNGLKNRELMVEFMFETINFPGLYLINQQVLSLYSLQKTTGIIIDLGGTTTTIVPFYESSCLFDAYPSNKIKKYYIAEYGSEYINQFIRKHLLEFNVDIPSFTNSIKEEYCSVSSSSEEFENFEVSIEENSTKPKIDSPDVKTRTLDLTNMTNIDIHNFVTNELSSILNTASELYFQPKLLDISSKSLPTLLKEVVIAITDLELHNSITKELLENICIVGGGAQLQGLHPRMKTELREIISSDYKYNIIFSENPLYSSWMGGAILSRLGNFFRLVTNQKEYHEDGMNIMNKFY